jgi:hypothetical protein
MLLGEIRDDVIKLAASQGVVTDEDNLNFDAINRDIVSASNIIAAKLLQKRDVLSSAWQLTTRIEYDLGIQSDIFKYAFFQVPMAINGIYTSFLANGGTCTGTIVQTRNEFNSPLNCMIPSKMRGFVENGILQTNSPVAGTYIQLTAAFANPLELVDFNPNYDNYPFDVGYFSDLLTILQNGFYKDIYKKTIDTKSDGTNTPVTP